MSILSSSECHSLFCNSMLSWCVSSSLNWVASLRFIGKATLLLIKYVIPNMYIYWYILILHANVCSVNMRFPVSVCVRGEYKNLMDLEYYFHHLSAYGLQSVKGGFTSHWFCFKRPFLHSVCAELVFLIQKYALFSFSLTGDYKNVL